MGNYIGYIDTQTIELANLAYEIGDFGFAMKNYSKAIERLNQYQGDSMQPILMAGTLIRKKDECIQKKKFGKSVLAYEIWKLSKSSFVKGNQCIRSLYLDVHKRKEKNITTPEKQAVFKKGNSFEDLIRNLAFPGGINIKNKLTNYKYFNSYTKYLVGHPGTQVIYEATFIEDLVLVMVDVLVKRNDGKFDLYEIKMNAEINEAINADLAVQYAVCKKRFGNKLNSFNLILGRKDENKPYEILDLTQELSLKADSVNQKIEEFKELLDKTEPSISMSEHCLSPYECEFTNYCKGISKTNFD